MPSKDPLDRPITLRELVDALDARSKKSTSVAPGVFRSIIQELARKHQTTDYVIANQHTYRIANQPARRVHVGDLVTVPSSIVGAPAPLIARVTAINLPAPYGDLIMPAVAVSPEDASRIEAVIGTIW